MAGPGGVEAGRASLKVLPDLSQFLQSLDRFIKRIERQVVVELPTTLDLKGIKESVAEAQARVHEATAELPLEPDVDETEFTRARERVQTQARLNPIQIPVRLDTKGLSATLSAFTKGAGIAGLGILAAGAVPQVLGLAGSLTQVVGVAGLLPAVIGGAVAGIGTLALGLHGFGDALKNVGDPEKFSEALKHLAPNAREAAKAVQKLAPAFTALQRSVQDKLFDQMGAAITEMTTSLLPELRKGLDRVASATGGTFATLLGSLSDLGGTRVIETTLTDTADAIANFAPGVKSLVSAFSQIGVIASSFLPGLSGGFSDLLGKFDDFIAKAAASGALEDFIRTGLNALHDLADVAVGAGRAIFGIVQAAQKAGGGTLRTLADLLGGVADAINSPAFQQGLTSFFAGVQAGASGLLSSALPAIGDLLADLGPVLADFARNAGPAIGKAIAALAPIAGELVKAFSPAVVALIQAVADVIVDMAPTLADWAESLQDVNPLMLGLAAAGVALLPTLVSIAGAIGGAVQGLGAFIAVFSEGGALAGVAAALGPILAVVAAVAALAAGFVLAYQNSQPIRDAVAQLGSAFAGMWAVVQPILADLFSVIQENWPQIKDIAAQVWSTVQTIIVTVLTAVRAHIMAVTAIISAVWSVFGDTIMGVTRAVFGTILGVIRGALDVIQGIFRTIGAALRGDWSGVWDGIKQTVSGAWGIIKSLIKGGLEASVALIEGLGGKMWEAGSALIGKLIDGIKSKLADVGEAASAVADKIKGFFGGSPVEEGPLLGWNDGKVGKNLADMLADGLYASQSRVAAAAAALASQVAASTTGTPALAGVGEPAGGRINVYTNDPLEAARTVEQIQTFGRNSR